MTLLKYVLGTYLALFLLYKLALPLLLPFILESEKGLLLTAIILSKVAWIFGG